MVPSTCSVNLLGLLATGPARGCECEQYTYVLAQPSTNTPTTDFISFESSAYGQNHCTARLELEYM